MGPFPSFSIAILAKLQQGVSREGHRAPFRTGTFQTAEGDSWKLCRLGFYPCSQRPLPGSHVGKYSPNFHVFLACELAFCNQTWLGNSQHKWKLTAGKILRKKYVHEQVPIAMLDYRRRLYWFGEICQLLLISTSNTFCHPVDTSGFAIFRNA